MTCDKNDKLLKKIIEYTIGVVYCLVVWLFSGGGYFWPAWIILGAAVHLTLYTYVLGLWCEDTVSNLIKDTLDKCKEYNPDGSCSKECKKSSCIIDESQDKK